MKGPVLKNLKGPVMEDFMLDMQPFSYSQIHATFYAGIISTAHRSPLLMGKHPRSSHFSQGQLSLRRVALFRGVNVAPDLSYLVRRKGHTPVHNHWLKIKPSEHNFPPLVEEVETLPTLNTEGLDNQKILSNQKRQQGKITLISWQHLKLEKKETLKQNW